MATRQKWCVGMKIHPMPLHEDPRALIEEFVSQHAQSFGELHGDIVARHAEVPDRFSDQGPGPRSITVSSTLLETVLFSRQRRQTEASTLKTVPGNGFGIVLLDGKGTRIPVRKHPRNWDGTLLQVVEYVPGAIQLSLEEELGHPIGGEEGIPEPPGYRLYVLWWPANGAVGGAVLAAGVLTKQVQVLYAKTALPAPIMERRVPESAGAGSVATASMKRRRDDDFGEVDENEGGQEASPSQSS